MARLLWQEIYEIIANKWLRNKASRCLTQLDTLDEIDLYARVVLAFEERAGRLPASWEVLIAADLLNGLSVDSVRHQYLLVQSTGVANVLSQFHIFPLTDDSYISIPR